MTKEADEYRRLMRESCLLFDELLKQIEELRRDNAHLCEDLQGFVDVFEKAYGNVLAILSKETMEKAKQALLETLP